MITVLLVDDHDSARSIVKRILEPCEDILVIGEARDAEQAFQLIKTLKPDIVLLDISLPDHSGFNVAEYIVNKCSDTKAIFMSGYISKDLLHHALRIGAHGYLTKIDKCINLPNVIKTVDAGKIFIAPEIQSRIFISPTELKQKSSLEKLSPRERIVLKLVVEGKKSREIAVMIKVSEKTVESFRSRVISKLGIDNTADIVKFAISHGITTAGNYS